MSFASLEASFIAPTFQNRTGQEDYSGLFAIIPYPQERLYL